jgi:glycyl-tRNA synthetase
MNTIGIKEKNLRFREHEKDELSHYSDGTFDIEYDFPSIGFSELQGIASRTDFNLNAHMRESKQDMSYFDPVKNTKYVPYVIEPSIGLTRLFLATLCDAYDTVPDGDEGGERIVLRLKPEVAPVKIAVLPLVKKLNEKAEEVFQMLSKHFMTWYDETGSIGKRYARFDEIGTPWCVTIDFDNSLEKNAVTIRDRDTAEQVIVPIDELVEYFKKQLQD